MILSSAAKIVRRDVLAPLVLAVALAASITLALGGGVARAAGTIPCSLTITDASGRPVTSIPANTQVVLTGTATIGRPLVDGDVALFQDGLTGLDVTGEPMTVTSQGQDLAFTLRTASFLAGDHPLTFTFLAYDGSDICETDPIMLHVTDVASTATDTAVDLSRASISAGESIDVAATVVQHGTAISPPDGRVTFWSKRDGASEFIQIGVGQPLVDGHASISNVGGWSAGGYTIEARYAGDTFQWGGSTGDAALIVHGGSSLAYGPSSATVAVGGTATLAATLTNSELEPAPGRTVTFAVSGSGDTCSATTNGRGVAQCSLPIHGPARVARVDAAFTGDDTYAAASAAGSLTITRASTTLTVAHANATSGGTTTLAATLATADGPLGGQSVTLSVGGDPLQSCTADTLADGSVSCGVAVTQPSGTYPVYASFAGTTDGYLASDGSNTLDVAAAPTTLTYGGDTTAAPGSSATLAFTLSAGPTPLADQPVTIGFDGADHATVTDTHGVARVVVTVPPGSTHTATATFAGDVAGFYAPSARSATVSSAVPTTLRYLGDTSVVSSGTASLKVRLAIALDDAPLANASVTIALASGETCTVQTDTAGIASCTRTITAGAGPDAITATYAGATVYLQSSTAATLSVTATRTAIALRPVAPTLRGASVQLSAVLSSTQTLRPLANKLVTLSLGGQSCTGTTNDLGLAACTIASVTAPVGLTTATARFSGDAGANGATDTRQAIVYGVAAGNSWFVVGDRDVDGNHVDFWGSQWARNNHLSRTSAPDSSFKGYAGSYGSVHAGSTWTSKPGNSSSPPAGALPSYMAVIVSSSMAKSGSTISGDVVKVVIVKTDAGYDANPGHPGTGTVVATLP